MSEPIQHTYFLDKETALAHYEREQEVAYDNGCTLRQFCYYSGAEDEPMVSVETPYLVNLPTSKLIDFFREYLAYPLPTQVELGQMPQTAETLEMVKEILAVFEDIQKERDAKIDDALFTQPVMAEWMAKQQIKTYKCNERVHAYQLCYAIGPSPDKSSYPKNLIFLPETQFEETIYEKSCRPPLILISSPFDTEDLKNQGQQYLSLIDQNFQRYLSQKMARGIKRLGYLKLNFSQKPWRVMLFTSHYTTVMKYAMQSMVKAFEQLGCEVLFLTDDEYSALVAAKTLEHLVDFNPHLLFSINHHHREFLPKESFQAVWWQDLMPEIQKKEPFKYENERDFYYAFGDYILEAITTKTDHSVTYQEQCADENIYFPPSDADFYKRRPSIVFVGSAYSREPNVFKKYYGEGALNKVLRDYDILFQQPISEPEERVALVHRYIASHPQYHKFNLTRLWIYFNRTKVIEYLIDYSPYALELYGYDWQDNPKTAPYYKGVIENGEALADLYRSVMFGLSVQPFMVGHQRLAEIKFCGAIPLVLWTPNRYEHRDYMDEVCAFNTLDELDSQLKSPPSELPDNKIREHFSYVRFAEKVLQRMEAVFE